MLLQHILRFFKDLGILTLLCITCVVIFTGAVFPNPFPQQTVGPFDLASFPTGLALYQINKSPHFYSISPLDDYYLDENNDRNPILTANDFQEKRFTTKTTSGTWEKYAYALQAYFQAVPLFYSLDGKNDLQMTAEVHDQNIKIHKHVRIPSADKILALGNTFKLDMDDFAFDSSGVLYTNPSTELRQEFQEHYGITLTNAPTLTPPNILPIPRQKIESGVIIVHNPHMSGFLVIKAQPNQELWLNLQNYLIEVIEPLPTASSQVYETSMTIGVLNTLKL